MKKHPVFGNRWWTRILGLGGIALLLFAASCARGVPPVQTVPVVAAGGAPAPIDPQLVRDQDDMTWDDYKPVPGVDWADPSLKPATKTFRIAILVADFEDQPFVMTLPMRSDLFGNPQIDPIAREDVPRFYADFWNKPQAINNGQTINGYWMEQSRGRFGIEVKAFGPYRMPKKMFQYGLGGFGQKDSVPAGYAADGRLDQDVDALWKAEAGKDIASEYDIVLRVFAGYDETCVWQEFGEMKFQTKDDIPAEWGNPDPAKPRWAPTRYVPWTSWKAAEMLWANSAIITGECSGAIRHEISHFAFKIGDNNNNPYVKPYRRAGSGPWDIMDRGSFNGPGGPHRRWLVPVTEGGAMPAGVMLRQRMLFGFVEDSKVLKLNRNGLAKSGPAVVRIMSRTVEPAPDSKAGIVVTLDGASPLDRTPEDDPAMNPLSPGRPDYDNYTVEVVQRIGYDSFTPDNGVLIAKNKTKPSRNGGPNEFTCFNWVIDARPEDIEKIDFRRPDGTPVMRTIADYRQLNDALFHAGPGSGSAFEWEDAANRLHFYVIDVDRDARGVLSYTVGVRSLDGSGPQTRGAALAPAAADTARAAGASCAFTLTNTGAAAATDPALHPQEAGSALNADIYRLSVEVEGAGWQAHLANRLAALEFGKALSIPVHLSRSPGSAPTANVVMRAQSESDPAKTATASCRVSVSDR